MRIFLCGDVMIGRGIDQVLPQPCPAELHERHMRSALGYVRLAEQVNGEIPRPVDLRYIWGAALEQFEHRRPDVRIVNLETSLTRSDDFLPKGINYRASPENARCLAAAGIDCCVLANNHVLDWGRSGLEDTIATLDRLQIRRTGAGLDSIDAAKPARLDVPGQARILVYSFATRSSGVPDDWAAGAATPGVSLLPDLSPDTAAGIADGIAATRQAGDVAIASIHWGPNWGHEVPDEQRGFAHILIERGGVSVVHGHSSHHAKAIEIYKDRLILYGCGDFIDDYEGMGGYDKYRADLSVMYFPRLDPRTGALLGLELVPLQIRRFRLQPASAADVEWLRAMLDRENCKLGTRPLHSGRDSLVLAPRG